jgi:type II secretory pathway component GspD/PulD (secretin)
MRKERMKTKVLLVSTLIVVFCSFFAMSVACFDQNKPVTLDAKDNDIRDILTGLARANSANLIMGNSVIGKITISLSNVPFIKALELISKSSGYRLEVIDDTIVVAKPEEINTLIPKSSKSISLKYAIANDVKQALAWVSAKEGIEIIADQRTNSIMIMGSESSFQKVDEIVKVLDVQTSEKQLIAPMYATKIFTLKYGIATSLQKAISDLCPPPGKVTVDERTNSLIIIEQPTALDKLSEIITQLDVQTEKEKQALNQPAPTPIVLLTQVFNLNYIEATAAQAAIQVVLSTSGKVQTFIKRKDIVVVEARDSGGGGSGGGGGMKEFYKDKWSDTLVVTDTPEIMEKVTALIAELDRKSVQLRIEAKMVEVSLDNETDLGISWGATHKSSGSIVDGYFPPGVDTTAGKSVSVKIGTLSTKYFENININLDALESVGKAKLLSNPSIIAIDNELAQMIVAEKVPIITTYESQFSSTTKVEFINIGVMLNVVPHVTEDGEIIMDAMPIVDSIKSWTVGDNPQPIISSRVANCRVRIKDGETLAIGGLIKDEEFNSSERIPILGRLPLIGRFFGNSNKQKVKTDLVIFITPKIIKED